MVVATVAASDWLVNWLSDCQPSTLNVTGKTNEKREKRENFERENASYDVSTRSRTRAHTYTHARTLERASRIVSTHAAHAETDSMAREAREKGKKMSICLFSRVKNR